MSTFNETEVLKGLKNFKVSNKVIEYYKNEVKGNKKLTRYQIKLKLYRNLLLSIKYDKKSGYKGSLSYYGNLQMLIIDNKMVHLENKKNKKFKFKLNKGDYIKLNKILGINY